MRIAALIFFVTAVSGSAAAQTWSVERLDFDASYPEGPVAQADRLLFVDYGGHSVRQVRSGEVSVLWHLAGCGPAGQVVLPSGNLLVTCYDRGSLVELTPDGAQIGEITADAAGQRFAGPNDLVVDQGGGVYFSTSGVFDAAAPVAGKLYYMTADREVRLIASDIHFANGVALAPDQKTLYLNEHLAQRILRFPVLAPGVLGERFVFARLPALPGGSALDPYRGPDGLEVDRAGRIYACEFGGGRVLVLAQDGHLVDEVPVPAPYVTNVALSPGGELYITASTDAWHEPYPGGIYVARQKQQSAPAR